MTAENESLPQKVLSTVRALESVPLPCAVGGAIALAYYAVPRATVDIDVNIFVAADQFDAVLGALAPFGIEADAKQRATVERDGQVRLFWDRTPVDLFFAYDRFHFHAATRTRRVPFADTTIPILAAEDLLVCKVLFDRGRDWLDVDQILLLTAATLDLDDVRSWLTHIMGANDARYERFEVAVAQVLGN